MKQKIYFELIWWVITAIVLSLIILPIYNSIGMGFEYYIENIVFIVVAITFGRYIFFLKHHWLSPNKFAKLLFVFIPIPIFMYLVDSLYDFQSFLDEEGIMTIMGHLPGKDQMSWSKFIKNEMLLFWSAAFVSNLLMPFRMLYSLSRDYRK